MTSCTTIIHFLHRAALLHKQSSLHHLHKRHAAPHMSAVISKLADLQTALAGRPRPGCAHLSVGAGGIPLHEERHGLASQRGLLPLNAASAEHIMHLQAR